MVLVTLFAFAMLVGAAFLTLSSIDAASKAAEHLIEGGSTRVDGARLRLARFDLPPEPLEVARVIVGWLLAGAVAWLMVANQPLVADVMTLMTPMPDVASKFAWGIVIMTGALPVGRLLSEPSTARALLIVELSLIILLSALAGARVWFEPGAPAVAVVAESGLASIDGELAVDSLPAETAAGSTDGRVWSAAGSSLLELLLTGASLGLSGVSFVCLAVSLPFVVTAPARVGLVLLGMLLAVAAALVAVIPAWVDSIRDLAWRTLEALIRLPGKVADWLRELAAKRARAAAERAMVRADVVFHAALTEEIRKMQARTSTDVAEAMLRDEKTAMAQAHTEALNRSAAALGDRVAQSLKQTLFTWPDLFVRGQK